MLRAPGHASTMKQHLLYYDLCCVLQPHRYHPQTISYQNHVHPRLIRGTGTGEIVGSDHGNGLPLLVEIAQRVHGDLLARIGRIG